MMNDQIDFFEKLLNTTEDLQEFLNHAAYILTTDKNERNTLEGFFANVISISAWTEDKLDELYTKKHLEENAQALLLQGDSY